MAKGIRIWKLGSQKTPKISIKAFNHKTIEISFAIKAKKLKMQIRLKNSKIKLQGQPVYKDLHIRSSA